MKRLLVVFALGVFFLSCSSDKEVKKLTDKGFQLVVQKYLDEYNKEYGQLQEQLKDADITQNAEGATSEKYEKLREKYIEFVSSEKNIKMIKSALEKKSSLKEEQIEQLEKMLREAEN